MGKHGPTEAPPYAVEPCPRRAHRKLLVISALALGSWFGVLVLVALHVI